MTDKSLPQRITRDERGAAIAMILLIGSVLVVLTGVIVARGIRQMGTTGGDVAWEQALNVAEAGMEFAINEKNIDSVYLTLGTMPSFADRAEERDWVIAQAASGPVISTPEGDFTIIVPEFEQVIYSVGYVPSRDAVGVRTRVVRREYDIAQFVAADGLLVGGDADLEANTVIDDPLGSNATVYVNGEVTVDNNVTIDGCLISAETEIPPAGGCPESPAPPAWIPRVRVRPYYALADLALCADGSVRGGPVHPSYPDPTPLTPCDASDPIINASADWKFNAAQNAWSAKKDQPSGVIYLYATNFDGVVGKAVQSKRADVTIIAERGSHACDVDAAGHISISSGSFIQYADSAAYYQTALIAEGDVKYRGGATVIGAVIAGEQVDFRGSPDSWGPVSASDECDSPDSPVSLTQTSGGAVIRFSGEVETLLIAGIRPTDWDEL